MKNKIYIAMFLACFSSENIFSMGDESPVDKKTNFSFNEKSEEIDDMDDLLPYFVKKDEKKEEKKEDEWAFLINFLNSPKSIQTQNNITEEKKPDTKISNNKKENQKKRKRLNKKIKKNQKKRLIFEKNNKENSIVKSSNERKEDEWSFLSDFFKSQENIQQKNIQSSNNSILTGIPNPKIAESNEPSQKSSFATEKTKLFTKIQKFEKEKLIGKKTNNNLINNSQNINNSLESKRKEAINDTLDCIVKNQCNFFNISNIDLENDKNTLSFVTKLLDRCIESKINIIIKTKNKKLLSKYAKQFVIIDTNVSNKTGLNQKYLSI